jgi:threonine/homoserine/homoserine lactone efflux protein
MPEEQNPDKIGTNPTPMQSGVEVFTNFFRAATRPAVTVIFAAVIAQVVVEGVDAPQWFLALATACILWWFGDRTVQHIKEKKEAD